MESSDLEDETDVKHLFVEGTEGSPYKDSERLLMQPLSPEETVNAKRSSLTISNALGLQGDCSGERINFSGVIQRVYRKMVKRPSLDRSERFVTCSVSYCSESNL